LPSMNQTSGRTFEFNGNPTSVNAVATGGCACTIAETSGLPIGSFFRRLRLRLKGTREKFVHRIDRLVLGKKVIDEDLLDGLEEILITSDLGVRTTGTLLRKVADKVKRKELSDPPF